MRHAKPLRCPILWACLFGDAVAAQVGAKVDFARDIQPLLREHCVECHGPSQQMRGLRLDRRRDAMPNRVGANGPRIIPGNGSGSLLYRRVSGTEAGARMPPAGALGAEQVEVLKAWIDEGAVWPDEKAAAGSEGGWTPLMKAALYGDVGAVRAALANGADPNARNDDGATALLYAVDNLEKTKVLLDGGADPNLRSGEGRTALLIAAGWTGSYPVVKLLLEKGADVKARLPDGRGVWGMAIGPRRREEIAWVRGKLRRLRGVFRPAVAVGGTG